MNLKAYLSKLGGLLATFVAIAGSPAGADLFGLKVAGIIAAAGQLLHAAGVHLERNSGGA